MKKSTIQLSVKPAITCNPLHKLIRNAARELIATHSVEDELELIAAQYAEQRFIDCCVNLLTVMIICHSKYYTDWYR